MKKRIVFLFLTCLVPFIITAQKKWGIAGGIGINNISGYKGLGINTSRIVTLQASVFAAVPLSKEGLFVLMPSLGYFPKGVGFGKVQITDFNGNVIGEANQKFRINYLQLTLPVTVRMKWGKNVEGYIGTGPYAAYAVSAITKRTDITATNGTIATSEKIDFKQANLNRFDAGLTGQFNVVFSKKWLVGFGGDIGLTKVNTAGTLTLRNAASHLYVGYLF